MKATYERINLFSAVAASFLKRNEGKETKPGHAIKKINNQLMKIYKEHEVYKDDINNEFADTDEKGHLIFDERGNYCYTKEQQKDRLKALRTLEETHEYEIEPYYATDVTDLTDFEKEQFTGFILHDT